MQYDAVASLDLPTLLRFSEIALAALASAQEEIDALNVYPVPDGDTGTNMLLTFESARNAMLESLDPEGDGDIRVALVAFARGCLLGARGNSGVILSQLMGALCKRLAAAGPDDRSAAVFAEGLTLATEASYAAVGDPVEGTILSVAKAASEAAVQAAQTQSNRLGHVLRAAASAARDAVERTPDQLQTLKDAGVVDAGGRGLCVILDAAERATTGKWSPGSSSTLGSPLGNQSGNRLGNRAIPVPLPTGDLTAEGPAYEVMYLLDADDDQIPSLRVKLAPLGDSLVVVGGDGLWNVHVHVDDVGAAVEAGIESGRPYRVRVTHFAEQIERHAKTAEAPMRKGRKVVVVAAGEGLRDLFAGAGATVVPTAPGRKPTTAQILEAVTSAAAAEVIVLPNEHDSIAVAEAAARAARESGEIRVAVIPTNAQVHGLAALAVHEPGRSFDDDILQMTAAARHARSGAVTIASKRAMTTAGPCDPGDVLGAVEGDFVIVGDDLFAVATGILERLLGGGGELVTVVSGAGSGDLADRCARFLSTEHPTVDVTVYDGGQDRYPLLLAVE